MRRLLKTILSILTPLRIAVLAALIIFLWLLIFGKMGIYQLNKLFLMKRQLMYQKETLSKDIERLSREKEMLSDPKNLEPVIRKELGYIKPGEIIFQERETTEGNSSPLP